MVLHIWVPQNVKYFLSGLGTTSSSSRILLHQVILLKCGVLLKCIVTVINFKHYRCHVWKFIICPKVLVWIIVFEISYLISEKILVFLKCVCVCVCIYIFVISAKNYFYFVKETWNKTLTIDMTKFNSHFWLVFQGSKDRQWTHNTVVPFHNIYISSAILTVLFRFPQKSTFIAI
jgi:hypothetical protein